MRLIATTRFASVVCAVLAGASWAAAQSGPPTQGIVELDSIERVPTVFNFQARVTQAKMGLEDAAVSVTVALRSGDSVLCTEKFENVRIRNSLLNLSIGTICNLDVHLAYYSDVDLLVCIENANCLEPIKLGSVPFALKSNLAVQAQYAPRADYAARSWIANRASADRQLAGREDELGVGYFDFYTHPDATAQSLEPNTTEYEPYVVDGFIQWAPLSTAAPRMHICALDPDTDTPAELAELMIHAATTIMRGNAAIDGGVLTLGSAGSSSAEIVSAQDDLLLNAANTITSQSLTVGSGQVSLGQDPVDSSQSKEGLLASDKTLTIDAPTVSITGNLTVGGYTAIGGGVVPGSITSEMIEDGTIGGEDIGLGEVHAENVDFSWARGVAPDGPAADLDCAPACVSGSEIVDGTVAASDVAFTFAGSTSQGGAADMANDLDCSDCVSASEVEFNYAGSTSEGGAASNLACSDCVSASEVEFNYAGSTSRGGAANMARDLDCGDCVSGTEVVDGTITASDVDSSTVQERITETCVDHTYGYMAGVDEDGGVTCKTQHFTVGAGWVEHGLYETCQESWGAAECNINRELGCVFGTRQYVGTDTRLSYDRDLYICVAGL